MASVEVSDSQKMFEQYLLDYLVKNNMHETAENFTKEAKIPSYSIGIHAPNGLLREWWHIFYDAFTTRQQMHQESQVENAIENQPNSMVPHLALDQQRPRQFPVSTDFDMMIDEPATSLLAAKVYEEEQCRHSMGDCDPNSWFHNTNNMNPLNSAASSSSHLQQQNLSQTQQQVNIQGSDLGRTRLMDTACYGQERFILPKAGLHGAGMNGGVNSVAPNKWPLDAPNHQPQFLAPTESFTPGELAFNFPGSPSNFPHRNAMLPRTDLSGNNAQMAVQMTKTAVHQLQCDQPQHRQSERQN